MINMVDSLWKALVHLSTVVAARPEPIQYLMIGFGESEFISLNQTLPPSQGIRRLWLGLDQTAISPSDPTIAVIRTRHLYSIQIEHATSLTHEEQELLRSYLAYCLLPQVAHQKKRAIAVSHFAQSLDGKIATNSGDSKWIGSPENLLHAHRMRALCDGIMIGTRTLANDQPSLTVRHVHGQNPRRIVISSSARDFSSLTDSCGDPVLVLGTGPESSGQHLNYRSLPAQNGHISCKEILEYLYQENILSVYVEGGAETTSNFLRDGMLDVMQLHLSPQIFGSGISGISLPSIDEVREAVRFEHFTFLPVGDSYMFVGQPEPPDSITH